MGIIVSKTEQNSRLTERINTDLRERAARSSADGAKKDPDLVEDSDYARNLKKTSRFGWIWAVLILLALISLVVIVVV
ncbi:hypothetical protein IJH74_01025 [Candidatus Saccharibacteria bacterium]|nr:hypothetical protein [Candidatus Saccharibacteria bacterium]